LKSVDKKKSGVSKFIRQAAGSPRKPQAEIGESF